ncbi:DUF6192 family protein [Streptomyces sp. AcE210]|uniref:DUF6192 family protein n=1 Tax=Streptomyces sp. AcE210 TaxID=2292703 RepID=UPI0023E7E1DD|nr:DUF6192 family protein [Streptomyces sp. AcE210]
MGRPRGAPPVSPQEKISAIPALAQADEVAAEVCGDLTRRPGVAEQVHLGAQGPSGRGRARQVTVR